jgi:hypothetical protein
MQKLKKSHLHPNPYLRDAQPGLDDLVVPPQSDHKQLPWEINDKVVSSKPC